MKIKLALAVLLMSGLIGCAENKAENDDHSHGQDSTTQSHSETLPQKLVLNEGQKWKLDEATRNNIDSIKKTVQTVAASGEKNYTKAAADLENDANRLVSQCRMSGKNHDMLHLWLEDFLSALRQLKTSPKEEQPVIFQQIESKVNEFGDFFE